MSKTEALIKKYKPKTKYYLSLIIGPLTAINVFFYLSITVLMCMSIFFFYVIAIGGENNHYVSYLALLASGSAITTLIYNARRHVSEDYFKEAKSYLERAYEVLNTSDDKALPDNDRMTWLTAARFLKTSERLSSKIIMSSHRESFKEESEYWKVKFRAIIKDFEQDYYAVSIDKTRLWSPGDRSPIAIASIYVIHKFIEWDELYKDPLGSERFNDNEIQKLYRMGFPKLASFLEQVRGPVKS
ncbi:hypothetical protein [Buttiauxella gaviniae]|uniref:hypothetical protein n=1 Tax=Buttiauxella gaviniae TaxID=82990 RepID=UPI0039B02430